MIQKGQRKRKFDREFKVEAVNLVRREGYSIKEASTRLGIGLSTLSKWISAFEQALDGAEAFPGKDYLKPAEAELKAVQKELKRVKRERDILKNALGYFANPQV
jgi:Transposase and inactivated derivatives